MAAIDFGGATLPAGSAVPIGATNYSYASAPLTGYKTPDSPASQGKVWSETTGQWVEPGPNSGAMPSDNNMLLGGLGGLIAGNNPATPTTAPAYTPMPTTYDQYLAQNNGISTADLKPWEGTMSANGTWTPSTNIPASYAAYAAQQNAANTPTVATPNYNFGSINNLLNTPQSNQNLVNNLQANPTAANAAPAQPTSTTPQWWNPQYIQQQQRMMQSYQPQLPPQVQRPIGQPGGLNINRQAQAAVDQQRRGMGGLNALNRTGRSLPVSFTRPTFRR